MGDIPKNWTNNSYKNSQNYARTIKVKPVLSSRIRKEAKKGPYKIPTVKTNAKELLIAIRKSELNKHSALKACVSQVDGAK